MAKKFLCGVANFWYYDGSENLVFQSKTMLTNALEVSISNEAIKAGQGNALQMLYFHSPELKITAEESQFNLDMIASSVGSSIATGSNVYWEETLTLGAGGATTVSKTPVSTNGGTIYGWWTNTSTGVTTRVTFTGSNTTVSGGTLGDVGCMRYYYTDAATRSLTINGNFIPSVGKIVLEAQLFSGDSLTSSSLIGKVFIEIPKASMMGTVKLNLSASGVSNTPIDFMALASTPSGCSNSGVYAYVKEQIFSSNWYDNVISLVSIPDPLTLSTATSPKTVTIYAIPATGSAFIPPTADLTITSSDATKFTVSGLTLTKVAVGTANLNYSITAKPSIAGQTIVTVS